MRWIDILSQSLQNLWRRKLRSMLTMLGVVIGTTAIIVTISLGYGAEKTQKEALQSSTNLKLINVYPYYSYGDMDSENQGRKVSKIDDSVLRQLRAMKGVDAVTPLVQIYGVQFQLETGKYLTNTWLTAVSPKDFEKLIALKEGTFFSGRTDRMEFIMSEVSMLEFRDPKKEIEMVDYYTYLMEGKELPLPDINWFRTTYDLHMIWDDYEDIDPATGYPKQYQKDYKAQMRGVIKADINDNNFWMFSNGAIVSLDWYRKLAKENKKLFKDLNMPDLSTYDQVYVIADSVDNVEQLVKDLKEFGVQVYSPLEWIDQLQGQIRTMQAFMGFIGAISMFVAALSIANTMMMSIYERTREIGVMKVLGCKISNIRLMFLAEAAYIGIFGGMIGVLGSYGLSFALNNVTQLQELVSRIMAGAQVFGSSGGNTSIIPPELSLGTWTLVILISVGSGIYPAQRAMHLSSLEAIRSAD